MDTILFKDLTFNADGSLKHISYDGREIFKNSPLWKIKCKNYEYSIKDMTAFSFNSSDNYIELLWENDKLRVSVLINYDDGYKFNLSAHLYNDEGIEKVIFPIFNNLKAICPEESHDYLMLPYQNGWLVKNPIKLLKSDKTMPFWLGHNGNKYENDYPTPYTFQFFSYYCEETFGCYLATEDAEAYTKTIGFYAENESDMSFAVTNYPENIGSATEYFIPYASVLKFHTGDWQNAAELYREWALGQKWVKGTLKERGINPLVEKTDLWRINHTHYALGTRTDEYFKTSLLLKERLDCELALHWYGWNMGEHDVNYPEYISRERYAEGWGDKLTAWADKFHENNIVVLPYVNARLWDGSSVSWDECNAKDSALKDENNEIYSEPWKPGIPLHPMCPATELWNKRIGDFSNYVKENHLDGLYVDQTGSYKATLCFDKSHSHPVGGGCWYKNGYTSSINRLRAKSGKDKIFTTESCCETYIDVFDLFLTLDTTIMYNGFFQHFVGNDNATVLPLFNMIYGDCAVSYGSCLGFSYDISAFEYNFMHNLLFGLVPTIEGFEMSEYSEADEHFDVMKRAVDFYKQHKDLFLYGRICGIPSYSGEMYDIYFDSSKKDIVLHRPAVIQAIWESDTKERYYIAYNISHKDISVEVNGNTFTALAKQFIIKKI